MTFLSRILGLVRDVVIAFFFGASAGADAFFLAFKIPNFFRRLFAEGAFSQAFVPVLSEYKQRQNTSDLKDLIDHLAGALSLLLFIFVVLGVVFSGGVITIFAFGYVLNGNSCGVLAQHYFPLFGFNFANRLCRLDFKYFWPFRGASGYARIAQYLPYCERCLAQSLF